MTLLEISGLRSGYGPVEVLHGIDMSVADREIVCILGNNAAGKSTVVKSILGIADVTAGTMSFGGERIDGRRPDEIINLGFAVVPEGGQVFTELTVLENLRMGLYLRPAGSLMAGLERVFALYPILAERRRQRAGLMSGGERQMLAMARALISEPRLLILDSPSMGLAPRYVHQQFDTLRRLNEEHSLTVLVIEQNASMALSLSHRAYVLQQGEIVLKGNSKDLLHNEQMKLAYLT
jgi:branched-chain amino acid transport system ATP-binding protein